MNEYTAAELHLVESIIHKQSQNPQETTINSTARIDRIEDLLSEMLGIEMKRNPNSPTMIVVSNATSTYGALKIVDKDVQRTVSDLYFDSGDYLVVPSSVHEVICTSIDMKTEDISAIVLMVNGDPELISEESFLSNTVLRYNREKGGLFVA